MLGEMNHISICQMILLTCFLSSLTMATQFYRLFFHEVKEGLFLLRLPQKYWHNIVTMALSLSFGHIYLVR